MEMLLKEMKWDKKRWVRCQRATPRSLSRFIHVGVGGTTKKWNAQEGEWGRFREVRKRALNPDPRRASPWVKEGSALFPFHHSQFSCIRSQGNPKQRAGWQATWGGRAEGDYFYARIIWDSRASREKSGSPKGQNLIPRTTKSLPQGGHVPIIL